MSSKKPLKAGRAASRVSLAGGALLIALAMYVMFPGAGLRQGPADPATESQDAASVLDQMAANIATGRSAAAPQTAGPTQELQEEAFTDGVLTLLIDEHDYLVVMPTENAPTYRPIPLEHALQLASQTTGDSNGIRVRILRRDSSRAAAEHRLQQQLAQIGIAEDAVYMASELIPR